MIRLYMALFLTPIAALGIFFGSASASSKSGEKYPLWDFDEQGGTCRFKGRLQDPEYCVSHLMDRIVADGKNAIPILISQLTQTRPTKEPIYDYWNLTSEGDIAYFILMDLFTEPNGKLEMPGLESIRLKCKNVDSETCWRSILKKHGRKSIQSQWLAAWDRNKEVIYWDESMRCFRLSSHTDTH